MVGNFVNTQDFTKEELLDLKDLGLKLKKYLNIEKLLRITKGIYNDETNGHIICDFMKPTEVALAWTDDKKDGQYKISKEANAYLRKEKDAKGRKLFIHKLMVPKKHVLITKEESEGIDAIGVTLPRIEGNKMAISYVNYYIRNGFISLPIFGDLNE